MRRSGGRLRLDVLKANRHIGRGLAPANSNLDRVILLGTGKLGDENADWEKFGATLSKQLSSSGANSVDIVGVANAEQAARIGLGASLGVYRYDNYRSELSDKEKPTLNSITMCFR